MVCEGCKHLELQETILVQLGVIFLLKGLCISQIGKQQALGENQEWGISKLGPPLTAM